MRRMEVRCCCQATKVLGTVPVPEAMLKQRLVILPLMGVPGQGLPYSKLEFEVATWAEIRPDPEVDPHLYDLQTGVGYIRETGVALKHEGVTVETLRRIPGFIEAKHGQST